MRGVERNRQGVRELRSLQRAQPAVLPEGQRGGNAYCVGVVLRVGRHVHEGGR